MTRALRARVHRHCSAPLLWLHAVGRCGQSHGGLPLPTAPLLRLLVLGYSTAAAGCLALGPTPSSESRLPAVRPVGRLAAALAQHGAAGSRAEGQRDAPRSATLGRSRRLHGERPKADRSAFRHARCTCRFTCGTTGSATNRDTGRPRLVRGVVERLAVRVHMLPARERGAPLARRPRFVPTLERATISSDGLGSRGPLCPDQRLRLCAHPATDGRIRGRMGASAERLHCLSIDICWRSACS